MILANLPPPHPQEWDSQAKGGYATLPVDLVQQVSRVSALPWSHIGVAVLVADVDHERPLTSRKPIISN